MSDQDIIDTIAGIITDESSECGRYGNGCQLGYVGSPTGEKILAALRERYAIVELPKPDVGQVDAWNDCTVHLDTAGEYVLQEDDMDLGTGILWHTPAHARAIAAALLAAANYAEEGQ